MYHMENTPRGDIFESPLRVTENLGTTLKINSKIPAIIPIVVHNGLKILYAIRSTEKKGVLEGLSQSAFLAINSYPQFANNSGVAWMTRFAKDNVQLSSDEHHLLANTRGAMNTHIYRANTSWIVYHVRTTKNLKIPPIGILLSLGTSTCLQRKKQMTADLAH
jgi:hypothetical protein